MTERITMALNDDDITTSGAGGEGPADGGSNPEGHDGGADGTAGGEGPADGGSNPEGHDGGADGTAAAKVQPTAAPIPKVTTAAPTAPRDRVSMLSRCIATDAGSFATRVLGSQAAAQPVRRAAPRLQRSALGRRRSTS